MPETKKFVQTFCTHSISVRLISKDHIQQIDNLKREFGSFTTTSETATLLIQNHFPGFTVTPAWGWPNITTQTQTHEDWDVACSVMDNQGKMGNTLLSVVQITRIRRDFPFLFQWVFPRLTILLIRT